LSIGFANVGTSPGADVSEPSQQDCEEQVRRIIQSATFRSAATLQSLFQFITAKTISGEADSLKEYTIGVEALGRRSDFDPRIDPIVRVQSHRLRVKLKEYYQTEGISDPVLIHFPKGHYVPSFAIASPAAPEISESPTVQTEPEPPVDQPYIEAPSEETHPQRKLKWFILGLALAACLLLACGYFLGNWHGQRRSAVAGNAVAYDPQVLAFWSHILGNDPNPVIAYPDAVFLLDDSNDLFRFRHGAIDSRGTLVDPHVALEFAANPELVSKAGPLFYENGYTGTGELESVAMLSGLLGNMGFRPIIKSSRDVLPEDLANHAVILLGSPFQNPAVAQLMTSGDFSFSNPDQHHEQWRAQIVNSRPGKGEAAVYGTERDPASRVLTSD
jgi:hypothetical protein